MRGRANHRTRRPWCPWRLVHGETTLADIRPTTTAARCAGQCGVGQPGDLLARPVRDPSPRQPCKGPTGSGNASTTCCGASRQQWTRQAYGLPSWVPPRAATPWASPRDRDACVPQGWRRERAHEVHPRARQMCVGRARSRSRTIHDMTLDGTRVCRVHVCLPPHRMIVRADGRYNPVRLIANGVKDVHGSAASRTRSAMPAQLAGWRADTSHHNALAGQPGRCGEEECGTRILHTHLGPGIPCPGQGAVRPPGSRAIPITDLVGTPGQAALRSLIRSVSFLSTRVPIGV